MRRLRPYDWGQRSILTQEEQESRAYVMIEEARIRCEQLESDDLHGRWRELHREVGLAGLCASAELAGWSRKILLEAAHVRSETAIPGARDGAGALTIALGRARIAIEHCLTMPEAGDHIHLAHVHLLCGIDLLQSPEARGLVDRA